MITLDGETCDLRPLDLVTHINGRAVKDMLRFKGKVCQSQISTWGELQLTVQRVHHIPPVEELSEIIIVYLTFLYCTHCN